MREILPPRRATGVEPTIQVQVRYRNPKAGRVLLVWGLNNWASAPDELPPGTFLTYGRSHMNTPMTRQGNMFVVDFQVEANTRLDYAFTITRTSAGEPVKIWRGGNIRGYYTAVLAAADDEVVERGGTWPIRAYVMLGISVAVSAFFTLRLVWYLCRSSPGGE